MQAVYYSLHTFIMDINYVEYKLIENYVVWAAARFIELILTLLCSIVDGSSWKRNVDCVHDFSSTGTM